MPSGKFVLRLPPKLHSDLKNRALQAQLSLNEFIRRQLSTGLPTRKKDDWVYAIQRAWGDNLLGIVRFGSSVRGEEKKTSDIDLLIVLDKSLPIRRELYREWDKSVAGHVDKKMSPQFSHVPNSESTSSLWLEVALEGEIEFENGPALREILYKLKEKIADGRFLRKMSHGQPYWVRGGSDAK